VRAASSAIQTEKRTAETSFSDWKTRIETRAAENVPAATFTLSHATLLSAALIPWHEATVSKGDQGGSGDFGNQELSDLRVGVGQLAGALRIWYAKRSPGVPEPTAISKWQEFCASATLPEVRRAFTACEHIDAVQS